MSALPGLIACGDLQHGAILVTKPKDSLLITITPALISKVHKGLTVLLDSLMPTFSIDK